METKTFSLYISGFFSFALLNGQRNDDCKMKAEKQQIKSNQPILQTYMYLLYHREYNLYRHTQITIRSVIVFVLEL